MRVTRRSFLGMVGGVTVAAALAACGGEDEPQAVVTTPSPTPDEAATETPAETPEPTETAAAVEVDDDLHRIVDKERALPEGYEPSNLAYIPAEWHADGYGGLQLRADVIEALEPMIAAAAADGVNLRIRSAYRSYWTQVETFAYWVDLLGEEQARRESAEPGHSEHQMGSTMDFADPANGWELEESFAATPSGLWLASNAYRFGFALSYPEDGEPITGYIYEPWHHRYIGIEVAAAWRESGLTLVEFLEELHGIA